MTRRFESGGASWPAGASGPLSTKVGPLAASTSYSFHLCGSDVETKGETGGCAQTLTFRTAPAVQDAALGKWNLGPNFIGEVDAHSGPAGQNPTGHIKDVYYSSSYNAFNGFVTCLAVTGNRASVGAVGQQTLADGHTTQPATLLFTLVDGGVDSSDSIGRVQTPGSTPPDCATASFGNQFVLPNLSLDMIVNDAP